MRGGIDGHVYQLGNHRLIEEIGLCSPDIEKALDTLERQGKTAVLLANHAEVLAIFAVADTLRETSRQAIADLHSLGVKTLMLTGDNTHTAEAIARAVGIDEARGNLLPEDKLSTIESLLTHRKGGKVGMVGDGINDAPSLARADIGFAMGAAGTDTAIETADVALMDDDLRKIPAFVRLSTGHIRRADPEHRSGARHQGGVSAAHRERAGHDVDGGIRGHGGELAGRGKWTPLVAEITGTLGRLTGLRQMQEY